MDGVVTRLRQHGLYETGAIVKVLNGIAQKGNRNGFLLCLVLSCTVIVVVVIVASSTGCHDDSQRCDCRCRE